jgi:hypothetical protein
MVASFARQLAPAARLRYLRAVRRVVPDTFAALRSVPLPALHFVGFRGDEVHSARRVCGEPDFWHRTWDVRARDEVMPWDVAVFAKYDPAAPPSEFAFRSPPPKRLVAVRHQSFSRRDTQSATGSPLLTSA